MPARTSSSPASLTRGIAWLLLAVTLFVGQDSLAKFLTTRFPVAQIVWARYAFHLLAMMPFLIWYGPLRVATTSQFRLQILRSLSLLAATVLFNVGLRYLPLATVTAITFASPLVITALAAVFLKERVDLPRWAAVFVGFAGVLVVVRPSGGGFDPIMVCPLAAAVCIGLYQLVTKALSARDGALTTLFWTGVGGCLAMSPVLPWAWYRPDAAGWSILAVYGAMGLVSHFMLIRAYRHASASALAPFFYVQLILAILSGVVFFHNLPDVLTLFGAVLICGSGVYVWYRQRFPTYSADTGRRPRRER
jgi:drug/metabolite transporter (DMT)-like permease